ncbi:MAG: CotH kinase family protein [Bacteroidota bacterium]
MQTIRIFIFGILFFLFSNGRTTAQTFSGTGGSIITLTDTSRFNIAVSGLANPIDFTYGLESVTINISHTQDRDIDCFLAAPDGTLIELTTDNGGTGDNYTNTIFKHSATNLITSGSAPFNGTYKPEGDLWRVNNNQNGNGTWQLRVIDDNNNGVTGSVSSWSVKFSNSPAMTFIFSQSSLPIVIINTNGQTIPDDPKIIADMKIIDNGIGNRNHLTDIPNNYNGKIAIEVRGSSSQMFPKKSFGFETRDNSGLIDLDTSLLGMPSEHDWILSANYTDKSFCRNVVSYQLANEMGHYAVRTKYVDVVLNGQYWGIYVFMESLKRDKNRVDISKLERTEITAPDITGGYILKIDKTTGSGGDGWTSPYAPINHSNGQDVFIQYDYPSSDSIVASQKAYIKSYVDSFENALAGPNFRDSVLGYAKFIGNGSWIDYFFSNELSKNVDGYRISSYLYKDKEKTLKAGPVWDYDIAYGNANYCDGTDTTGWAYLFSCTGDSWQVPFWWQKLLQDTNYTNQMKCRWTDYRSNVLSLSHINSVIDSITTLIDESKEWNFNKWPILGTYVWPNPSPQPSTYAGEIQNLKNWMSRRLSWLDANMPGKCNCTLNIVQQNVSCFNTCDGQLIAVGTSPYQKTYEWDNGSSGDTLSGMCSGTQTVTFKDAIGCTRTATATITEPAVLVLNTSAVNAPCNASGCTGQATASVSGGTTPYTYAWSNGQTTATATALCSGTYTVNVTDAKGCSKTSTVTINNPSSPIVTLNSATNPTCFNQANGSASVSVTGGVGPYTYSWSPSGGNNSSASNLAAGNYVVTATDATGCPTSFNVTLTQPTSIALSVTANNVRCFGASTGSALASASGGTGAYQFTWLPSGATGAQINNLPAGNYSVRVTDANSCSRTEPVTITQAPLINANISSTVVNCNNGNDGSASVIASGGTGSLTYLWNPGSQTTNSISGLTPGTYSVAVRDSFGCTVNQSVTLTNPPLLTASTSSTTSICTSATGSAQVSASGGTGTYSYLWQPNGQTTASINNIIAGNYSVTVTDQRGCTVNPSVIVNSASGMTVNVANLSNVSCFGGTNGAATVSVTGAKLPMTFEWSPIGGTDSSATNLPAGVYSVEINDDNGCTTIQQITIQEPDQLIVSATQDSLTCFGGNNGRATANVTGGTAPYTYLWSPSGGVNSVANNLIAGNYTVNVTDANNCSSTQSVSVLQPTRVSATSSVVNSTCGNGNGFIRINPSGGTAPYSYSWNPFVSTADSAYDLMPGNYSITVIDANACSRSVSVTVSTTSLPEVTVASMTETSCNSTDDGSIILSTTGGTGTLIYSWLPDVSNSSSATQILGGIYSIVVTDAIGCQDSIGVILPEPSPLGALMIPYDASCYGVNDGRIVAHVGGGTSPYTYLWTPGAQVTDSAINLSPGTYSVLMTDSRGCTAIASATVQSPDSLSITSTATLHTCYSECNGFAELNVSGGSAPYSYLWCNSSTDASITNACAGICTVQISDAMGCIENRQFTFTQDDSLTLVTSHTNASCISCSDGTADATVSGGFPPYRYSWTPGNFTTASISGLTSGTYFVCITDSNACVKCDSVIVLEPGTATEVIKGNNSPLYVYPNPAGDYAVFAFMTNFYQSVSIKIYDVTGKLVKTVFDDEIDSGEHLIRVETRELVPGVYYYAYSNRTSVKTGALIISK